MNTFERIYEIVKLIPRGKVATYGQIAALSGNPRLSRVVGYALHVNPDPSTIKCHRVVKRDGSLSEAFAFGGENKQRELLENEGVHFNELGKVIMNDYLWDGVCRKELKAVLFDFDGTIADSLHDIALSVKEVFEKKGYPVPNKESVKNAIGNGIRNLVKTLLPIGLNEDEIEDSYQHFRTVYSRRICDNTELYDGIGELIEKLQNVGVKVAVVSNKAHEDLVVIMNKIAPNVEYVLGTGENTPRKPSPIGAAKMLKVMGVNKEDAVFVGDSKNDYDTAQNINMDSIIVNWGYGKKHELEQCTAAVFADTVQQLEKNLLKY